MKSSIKNRIFNFMDRSIHELNTSLCTLWVYVKSLVQDVKIGTHCRFMGNMKFNVANGGKIIIGEGCRFVSKETYNNMGINHRCIFSATPALIDACELIIGKDCGFSGTSIWCFHKIIIGNQVRCGANTTIMDGDAHLNDKRTSPPKPIVIEDNVFLGANVIVKKGVTIGANSVIGMNSIVTKDIPANSVAVGIPCRVIRKL